MHSCVYRYSSNSMRWDRAWAKNGLHDVRKGLKSREVLLPITRFLVLQCSCSVGSHSLCASPKFGLNLGAVTSAPHIHWGEMASMKKKHWVGVCFLAKLVDEASLVALSRMIWIDQQFSRLQNFDWSTWTVQAPFESAIHELLLRRRSWWIALSCLWCPFWTNLLEMEIPKVWRNILSTPERYGSGDRSFASWPTQIVSVTKSHVVDRWNAVLCLQKSLCSRPDRCHCHRFCRRLCLLFILVHYRQLDLTPVDFLPTIFSGTGAVFMNFLFDEEVGGSHFLVSGDHSDDIHRKWRSPKCRDILWPPQKGMEVAIEVWQMDRHKLCRSPSHTLSIDETQCFACKNHSVVALFVVIAIVLVVDLVNTLFLCIAGQPDWTLVDLYPKFSLKSFGIYHQSSVLFVDIIFFFSFFLFFFFSEKAHV